MDRTDIINRQMNPFDVIENRVKGKEGNVPNVFSSSRILVIIPAFNEERFIGSVILRTFKFADIVLVVDDGSTDATSEVAESAGAIVVKHPHNSGKGVALNTGFTKARELDPNVVITIDADGQHIPEEISLVVQPVLDGLADIVIGSRYIERKSQVPRHRIAGHWIFNRITSLASGVSASDSQSGYRAFSLKAVKAISFHSNGFSVESEMQFIARENELRLVEVPITIRYQDPPKRSVIAHGLSVLNGILHLVGQYRPLLFFGVTGLFLMGIGFAWGWWVMSIYSTKHQLATGYALISVLLSIIGLVLMSTGLILHSVRGLLIDMLRTSGYSTKR